MTKQEVWLYLVKHTNNLSEAKEAFAFLCECKVSQPKPVVMFGMAKDLNPKVFPDGVYIIYNDGHRELFDGKNSKDNVKCVGVKHRDHALGVSLRNRDSELPMKDEADDRKYYNGDLVALEDFNGEENTKRLIADGLSLKLDDGEWIPSLGELAILFKHKKALNEALEYVGGDIIPNVWHWSSTENSATHSWFINFSNGHLGNLNKSYTYSVRAVCAF